MEEKRDQLEQFIIENREDFDAYEPSPNIWDKIVLDEGDDANANDESSFAKATEDKKARSINWMRISYRAAAAILIFIGSYFFHKYISSPEQTTGQNQLAETQQQETPQPEDLVIPELMEAEAYYTSLVDTRLKEINVYAVNSPEIKEELEYDMSELDAVYAELKQDLMDNAGNEEIIEAMIQNYRIKLDILEDLLSRLKNSSEKNENHENTSYAL